MIRQPIVSVLGHVDHGKTTLLDTIRGSAVAEREAGGITQHIGATEIPINTIEKICSKLAGKLSAKIALPGLLFIDTPGHEAFVTLRKRGGALADMAILVVDVNEGFQAQTVEALNILKNYRTPFLVAANKIDKIAGWQAFEGAAFASSFSKQSSEVTRKLDSLIYEFVGKLYEHGFESERFDRVTKFEKQVAILPVSAKTGEGIPELLMMLIGLSQKFMEKQLETEIESPAKGTVLEVKEEEGLGTTIDVIIYDGKIKRGDVVAVGGKKDVIVTKVRSLLKPKPLDEIRDPRFKFDSVKEAHASCGIKIAAPHLDEVLAGSSLKVATGDAGAAAAEVRKEIEEVRIDTEKTGIVVKADTLGSLEALINILGKEKIPIRKADVGDISRRDVVEAETVKGEASSMAVILGFNVGVFSDAEELAGRASVKILRNNVIYRLIEEYKAWILEEKERETREVFERLTKPAKIRILPGYVFRASKPAIIGIEVLAGILRSNTKLMSSGGKVIGTVKGLQDRNENVEKAGKGAKVAMAVEGAAVGKQINEDDILYTEIPENEAKLVETKYIKELSLDESEAFEEIKKIKRKENLFWAVGGV